MEKYYLANQTKNLYFTLLGDCFAHSEENHSDDAKIVTFGKEIVEKLNKKYGSNIFNFVSRRRKYNKVKVLG